MPQNLPEAPKLPSVLGNGLQQGPVPLGPYQHFPQPCPPPYPGQYQHPLLAVRPRAVPVSPSPGRPPTPAVPAPLPNPGSTGAPLPHPGQYRRPPPPPRAVPASTSRGTSERIIRSFSQSGSSSASSDVSTRNAVGSGFFSGNQMSSSAWNSLSPASRETAGSAPGPLQDLTLKAQASVSPAYGGSQGC